ncbi:VOC family protein [Jeotgalibacillus proteolyticus]|uniref:Lactoylglutathione lyase n=1 Tax=Jeotgalibacillus proteolyticus TaxID=2082395 RepID=A0A2S5G837_9BACL|nr:VOC family protein [Jeotgalibacillus proteolyticus]PPA69115.1 lactoylglutathione lyase [Jeotgalibacillus proteolyticus]
MKQVVNSNKIAQIGIVVHDIERTSQAYADFFGMEKPDVVWTDGFDKAETEYREEPTDARARLVYFNMGSVQLELIQPNGEQSIWQEFLDNHGEGVQHIGLATDKIDERVRDMDKEGIPLLQKGKYAGDKYAYVDTNEELKVIFELLENKN